MGVPRNGGRKQQLAWSRFTLNSLHAQTLMLTDVQTSFLGTPLILLKLQVVPRVHLCRLPSAAALSCWDVYDGSASNLYTRSPLEDPRLFGPSPWKVLATTYEKNDLWETQPLAKIF